MDENSSRRTNSYGSIFHAYFGGLRGLVAYLVVFTIPLGVVIFPPLAGTQDQQKPVRQILVASEPDQWPFKPWSYAKAFTFNFFPARNKVQLQVYKDGIWSPHVRSTQMISRDKALKVVKLVSSTKGTFIATKCPFPRHAFVFFNDKDQPVASVDVCFECNDLFAWPNFNISEEIKYGRFDDEKGELVGGLWAAFESAMAGYKELFVALKQPVDWRQKR